MYYTSSIVNASREFHRHQGLRMKPHKLTRIRRLFLFSGFFLLSIYQIAFSLPPSHSGSDSTTLSKVSVAARHDHKGYVIRFHLSSPVDSFLVLQPAVDQIQLLLYKKSIKHDKMKIDRHSGPVEHVKVHDIPWGLGVDIKLKKGDYFICNGYPDRNGHDFLLGLTTASKKDVDVLVKGIVPFNWSRMNTNSSNFAVLDSAGNTLDQGYLDQSYLEQKKKMKFDVVVIDAGHGGKDPGTIGYHHIEEKNIALSVALKVGHYITKNLPGVKVVYTRHNDTFIPLKERGHIANKAKGDLFISIHCNSSPAHSAHGTEIWILGQSKSHTALEVMKRENSVVKLENDNETPQLTDEQLLLYELANSGNMANAQKLATLLDHQFKYRAHRHTRGVKQAGFVVLYYASMPAILVELGFISNKKEALFLDSDYGQNIMASAIYRAVKEYKEEYDRSQNFTSSR